jgi:hypothetical protein
VDPPHEVRRSEEADDIVWKRVPRPYCLRVSSISMITACQTAPFRVGQTPARVPRPEVLRAARAWSMTRWASLR